MNTPRVLLTGATGSFGRRLALDLHAAGCELVLLVRGRDAADARQRAFGALGAALADVTVVRGDVGEERLGLRRSDALLACSADIVVHAAATTEFGLPLEQARQANLEGTRNVLALAERSPALERLVHVSTAFVAGQRCGRVLECELEHDAGFVNSYEQSKHEAERLVSSRHNALPIAILRPSVVAEPAEVAGMCALWFVLRLIERGLLPVLPGAPTNPVDLIDAADAAAASASLILAHDALGTFHVASGERAPRLDDIIVAGAGRSVRYVERDRLGFELERLRRIHPLAARSYDALASFLELLTFPKLFDTSRAAAALGHEPCTTDPLQTLVPSPRAIRAAAR